jgi:hypothetical protein
MQIPCFPPSPEVCSPSPVLFTTFRIRIEVLEFHHEFGEGSVSGVQDIGDPTVMLLIFVR